MFDLIYLCFKLFLKLSALSYLFPVIADHRIHIYITVEYVPERIGLRKKLQHTLGSALLIYAFDTVLKKDLAFIDFSF